MSSGHGELRKLTYREAVREAIREAMHKDERVFLMGEDVGRYGGCFAVSKGLLEEFGPERIRDTPLSESAFVGAGIGAALGGMRPIVEIMTVNFSLLAADQILNNAATYLHMSGGLFNVPLVIRMATGGGRQVGAQHSRCLEGWYAHIPGIKVLGNPDASVFAIGSDGVDIYEVADELALRGWYFDRQHFPASLHVTVTYAHATVVDALLADLAASVAAVGRPSLRKAGNKLVISGANAAVRLLPERWVSTLMKRASGLLGGGAGSLPGRMAPMYGMIGTLPNRGDLRELVTDLLDDMTSYQAPAANPPPRER